MPCEVGRWATEVWIVWSVEKLKVVVTVDVAEHQINGGIEIAYEGSSQWWLENRTP